MSRYFPHTAYAEDQPLSHTILTTHVLTRAITMGTVIGAGSFTGKDIYRRLRGRPPVAMAMPRSQLFFRAAGVSTLWTLGIVSLGLVGRMWGREEIEWQDRSWRLLENQGQVECDDWTYGGMLAGLGAAATVARPRGLLGVLGLVGTGSLAGMFGYMGWRYGVHGGKFPTGEKPEVS
ncbi:hypothetical protein JX265_004047 [Neoarthrinium moseri]|uniref:Uncharacterized protein n=1 Tax=Neoarthrinium moseri TaxID=1658444 RepID=A0A9P9WRK7_9PEZI|nr:hypothetical protein JX265_004047 [Neoarthrinium moseri]